MPGFLGYTTDQIIWLYQPYYYINNINPAIGNHKLSITYVKVILIVLYIVTIRYLFVWFSVCLSRRDNPHRLGNTRRFNIPPCDTGVHVVYVSVTLSPPRRIHCMWIRKNTLQQRNRWAFYSYELIKCISLQQLPNTLQMRIAHIKTFALCSVLIRTKHSACGKNVCNTANHNVYTRQVHTDQHTSHHARLGLLTVKPN